MSTIIRIVLVIVLVVLLVWNYRSGLQKNAPKADSIPVEKATPESKPAPDTKPVETPKPTPDPKADAEATGQIAGINVQDLAKALEMVPPPVLLDVREPEEYAEAHVPGAKLYPLGSLVPDEVNKLIQKFDLKEKKFYLICRSGRRSLNAAERFQKAGAANPVNVTGGTNAWIEAGFKTIKGKE